jgi:hypothetical protein
MTRCGSNDHRQAASGGIPKLTAILGVARVRLGEVVTAA